MYRLWNELDSPVKSELNTMIQEYHHFLMNNGWNMFYGINVLYLSGQTMFVWFFLKDQDTMFGYFKFLFPFIIVVFSAFDIIIKKNPLFLRYVFIVFIILMGIGLTHENLVFDTFKIYEVWPMYYFFTFLIGILHCLDAKKLILAFWFASLYYNVQIHIKYGRRNHQFY